MAIVMPDSLAYPGGTAKTEMSKHQEVLHSMSSRQIARGPLVVFVAPIRTDRDLASPIFGFPVAALLAFFTMLWLLMPTPGVSAPAQASAAPGEIRIVELQGS